MTPALHATRRSILRKLEVRLGCSHPDHEALVGDNEGQHATVAGLVIAATCFGLAALWAGAEAAKRWLQFRRVCSWHEPKPIRIGGNPLAWRTTNGLCPECYERLKGQYARR